jgi:sec-independent protein translocase protein TatA
MLAFSFRNLGQIWGYYCERLVFLAGPGSPGQRLTPARGFSKVEFQPDRQAWRIFMFEGLFQPMHLLVIFFIALLVFGPKKLPELGKGIGEGIRALKAGMKETPAEPAKNPDPEVKS